MRKTSPKVKMARKMITRTETKAHVGVFDTAAWRKRKEARARRTGGTVAPVRSIQILKAKPKKKTIGEVIKGKFKK